jgi:hypothetical protein
MILVEPEDLTCLPCLFAGAADQVADFLRVHDEESPEGLSFSYASASSVVFFSLIFYTS